MITTTSSIKMWAEDDRPREKLINKGKSTLSDAELIAILLLLILNYVYRYQIGVQGVNSKSDENFHKHELDQICKIHTCSCCILCSLLMPIEYTLYIFESILHLIDRDRFGRCIIESLWSCDMPVSACTLSSLRWAYSGDYERCAIFISHHIPP